jgi:NAD(P)-dependent dehydrogenase (short-subunit alcohol dehydrogenase family)
MSKPLVLITGASTGIGASTAILAAKKGYDVAITYLQDKLSAEKVAKEIQDIGANTLVIQADVSIETDILKIFSTIDEKFGRIDALVNNAGILKQKLFLQTDYNELQKLFAVNVIGAFICAREAVKRMAKSKGGRGGNIVNVSSIAARVGSPFEYIDYAASKGAIDSFTLGLAKEVAEEGIRVNAVRPGIINTELHAKGGEPGRAERIAPSVPMKRAGEAVEVAEAILWLMSDESSFVTGHLLDVGGGR